jgi:hypothetical protein
MDAIGFTTLAGQQDRLPAIGIQTLFRAGCDGGSRSRGPGLGEPRTPQRADHRGERRGVSNRPVGRQH